MGMRLNRNNMGVIGLVGLIATTSYFIHISPLYLQTEHFRDAVKEKQFEPSSKGIGALPVNLIDHDTKKPKAGF